MTTQTKKDAASKAVIIGATGATGRALLTQLLEQPQYAQVEIFVRRAPDVQHEKLRVHIVDFMQPETWASEVQGDILFSCLGTTLWAAKKRNGVLITNWCWILLAQRGKTTLIKWYWYLPQARMPLPAFSIRA